MRTIFHIASRADWEGARALGHYRPGTLDAEGFIHFSRPHQLLGTAQRFFQGQRDLVLVQVAQELVGPEVRYERADGQCFPHLYGALNLEAVVAIFTFSDGDAGFALPPGMRLIGQTLIRPGQPGDEAEIASVHTHAWQQSYRGVVPEQTLGARPLGFHKRMLFWASVVAGRASTTVFVAESANHGIVAFCSVGPDPDEQETGLIESLYCLDHYKAKGIGAALFQAGRRRLKEQGHSRAKLWVLKDNPSVGFYRRMGGLQMPGEKVVDLGAPLLEVSFVWSL